MARDRTNNRGGSPGRSPAVERARATGGAAERPRTNAAERRLAPLAPSQRFRARIAAAVAVSLSLVILTLAVGMGGYHWIERLSWLDSFHQAALLLSGMGPVIVVDSTAGKIFDGIYALFCGIALLAVTGILLAPFIHRVLHRFHLEDAGQQ